MKAIILLSGGLDSAVILAQALEQKKQCIALTFDYGQLHRVELEFARKIAAHYGTPQHVISIDNTVFTTSGLVNDNMTIPQDRTASEIAIAGTPPTYVPARNTIFLSYALGLAEMYQADEIHYGANALDNAYPDCLPAYVHAFQQVMNVATQQAVEGHPPRLIAPLLHLNKKQIATEALRLGVPLNDTFSCYRPVNGKACNHCDACHLRNTLCAPIFS